MNKPTSENKLIHESIASFGPEVTLTTENDVPDVWCSSMLREVGKTMKPTDMDYMGSVSVHFYATKDQLHRQKYEAVFKHQFVGAKQGEGLAGSVGEQFAVFALSDLALRLRQHYHSAHKNPTRNPQDKR